MAIIHIAWLRFQDTVPATRIDQHLAACRAMVGKVPAVTNVQCGPNTTDRAGGFTHAIVVTLPNPAAIPLYLEHPAHVAVADALIKDVAELRVMDVAV